MSIFYSRNKIFIDTPISLLKEVWALKSQVQTMVPSEDYKKLEEKLKEKDSMINQLEEELESWPKKLGDEVKIFLTRNLFKSFSGEQESDGDEKREY